MEEITKFLIEAPDDKFLVHKVGMIFGVAGACRREELYNLKIEDIEESDRIMIGRATFECHPVYHKYLNLRPSNAKSSHLFLNYGNGKCTNQVIGKGTIGRWPSKIAEYLSLKNPVAYTGHSFRRTSATLLANKGEDILGLKRHGGWKSSSTAEGYIEDSIENKIKFEKKILHSDKKKEVLKPSTSMSDQENKENSMWGNTDIGASLLMSSVNHNNEKGELQESNDCPTDAKIMSSTSVYQNKFPLNAKVLWRRLL
ncbi:hypothetical protein NQ315_014820 [Exocentrus adspersus]|uniref:Tyr recombinase domain-containing protein n=1 Tax=Exocentrus adspersus TaxID=1586481 RepID=A0AAV8VM26_9CUCU|nr:hypothetical protein NQ315_014820 [Exocentrus adspersus]